MTTGDDDRMPVLDLRGMDRLWRRYRSALTRERALFSCLLFALVVAGYERLAPVPVEGMAVQGVSIHTCELRRVAQADWLTGGSRIWLSWEDRAECLPIPLAAADGERAFEEELSAVLAGYPMQAMAGMLAQLDRPVAAFLVGIAKKESNWGRRVPTKDGVDCYNYWGFKSSGSRGTAMGHACFGSPEEAVSRVGARIQQLVYESRRDTPGKMVIWKCGSSCAWDRPENVERWIRDVALYYHKVMEGSAG